MKISLVGVGFRVLSVVLSIFLGIFTYAMLFLIDEQSVILSTFIIFVFVFCLFSVYIAYGYGVILSENHLITKVPFKRKIEISEITKIYYTDDENEMSIYIQLQDSIVRLTGYMILFDKKKGFNKTRQIVAKLNEYVFKKI